MKALPFAAFAGFALLLAPIAVAADAPVKVSSGAAIKGTRQVVVGAFNIGFLFQSVDSGKTTGGLSGAFGGVTSAKSVLAGVTPEMMQAITDAAYADFTTQLGARGFTVVEPAGLYASAAFARVKPERAPYALSVQLDKKSTGKASYYTPHALPGVIMIPGDFAASGFSGMGMTMKAGNAQYGMSEHAKASGQAVIDVTYLIDFSNLKRPGAFSMKGLAVTAGVSVVDDQSRLSIVTPAGKTASLTINEPVAVEGDLATMEDSTKGKTGQKVGNVLGGLAAVGGLGGLKFGKSRTYTFTAKPEYQEGATKAATLANTRLLDQLAALR